MLRDLMDQSVVLMEFVLANLTLLAKSVTDVKMVIKLFPTAMSVPITFMEPFLIAQVFHTYIKLTNNMFQLTLFHSLWM